MEFMTSQTQQEYEDFVSCHPQAVFMQSAKWPRVKSNWGHEAIISRNTEGKIVGTMLVLIQKMPLFGTHFLYSPRGPVCDIRDRKVIEDLTGGVRVLAKKYNAHCFKCDPDVFASDTEFENMMKDIGYKLFRGGLNFDSIQPRYNYRLYLGGRSKDELFANLTQKTRYNVRVAMKKGVEIKVVGLEYLDEFARLMNTTGERDKFSIRPKSYFKQFLEGLGDHARMYMGFYNGQAVCGAIATQYAGKTHYVYGASDNVYRNVMPNYLMQWEMISWAQENGCDIYDFLGVSGDLDESNPFYGLYRFKRGFNGDLVELTGEFYIPFKPLIYNSIEAAKDLRVKMIHLKRKLS